MSEHIFPIVVMSDLIRSEAYSKLSGASHFVYQIFLSKRQLHKNGRAGKSCWIISNNGKIVFPYKEAVKKYHISNCRFARSIDDLISHGFLKITKPGNGLLNQSTLYWLDDMWRNYGTDKFKIVIRKKQISKKGFCGSKE